MKTCRLCGTIIETQWVNHPGITVFVPDGSIFMDSDEYHFHKSCLDTKYEEFTPMQLIEIFGFNTKEMK